MLRSLSAKSRPIHPGESQKRIDAVEALHKEGVPIADIVTRLQQFNLNLDTVTHVLEHGLLPPEQMPTYWEETLQRRIHLEAIEECDRMNQRRPPTEATKMSVATTFTNAWQANSQQLTEFAWDRFAIKRDRHGIYSSTGSASWSKARLTKRKLTKHCSGELTLGCGSTSLNDECWWVAWDLDNHTDSSTNQNLNYAIVLRDRMSQLDVECLIEDSDGKGSIHVWVFFERRVPAAHAHRFANWIARDFKGHGLKACECFPKSATVKHTEAKCGTYLRLPGKHHKRDHQSRFWGGSDWLGSDESVQLLLNAPVNSPIRLGHAPLEETKPKTENHSSHSTVDLIALRSALAYISCEEY